MKAIKRSFGLASVIFPLNQLCAKLSILFLYHRILDVNRKYDFCVEVARVLQMLHTIENILLNIFSSVSQFENSESRVLETIA